jgi:hypothetical protein
MRLLPETKKKMWAAIRDLIDDGSGNGRFELYDHDGIPDPIVSYVLEKPCATVESGVFVLRGAPFIGAAEFKGQLRRAALRSGSGTLIVDALSVGPEGSGAEISISEDEQTGKSTQVEAGDPIRITRMVLTVE